MKITREFIEKGKSANNGWNNRQWAALGVTVFKRGWAKALIGKDITEEMAKQFIELKDEHFKKKIKNGANVNNRIRLKLGELKFAPVIGKIPYSEQYLHPNWQKMRLFVLDRDKYMCINCRDTEKTLHAHHLKYIRDKHVWDVPHWYIVTLCEDCHSIEHGRDLRAH